MKFNPHKKLHYCSISLRHAGRYTSKKQQNGKNCCKIVCILPFLLQKCKDIDIPIDTQHLQFYLFDSTMRGLANSILSKLGRTYCNALINSSRVGLPPTLTLSLTLRAFTSSHSPIQSEALR